MQTKLLVSLLLTVAISYPSTAATTHMQFVETRPGEWDVLVEVIPENGDVLGLAGFAFVLEPRFELDTTFHTGNIGFFDPAMNRYRGFPPQVSGILTCDSSCVGGLQATTDGQSEVFGIGIESVFVDGPSTVDIDVGVPALLGTLDTPRGLDASNFKWAEIALFPAGYTGLANGPLIYGTADGEFTVTVTPIPEPGTLAITTIALATVVANCRRKI